LPHRIRDNQSQHADSSSFPCALRLQLERPVSIPVHALLFSTNLLNAFSKPADDQSASSDYIPTAASQSSWATPSHSESLLPSLAMLSSAAIPNPARAKSAAAGCAIR